jgi:TP901 family phage tail tape measure protein
MPDYAVHTKFTARDGVSATFDAMGRSADRFHDRTSTAFRNATKHGYKFGTVVKGILAATAIHGGIRMVGSVVQNVSSNFLDFDDTMVSAAAKFDDVGLRASNFGEKLNQLKSDWRTFAVGSRFSANEVAKSAEIMAESGFDSAFSKGVTPYLIKTAQANRSKDLGEFTDTMTGIFNGFNMKTGNAAKDSQSFVTLMDQITQGAIDARGGITDLKESLKVLAPIWQESESSASTIAFASVLQNAGFPGEMVATAGKNAKLRLASPNIVAGLKASGIDVTDPMTGKVKKNLELYEEINAKMKAVGVKPGSAQDIAINEALFGKYAIAGNKSMIQHLAAYRKEIERIESRSRGVAGTTSDIITKYSTMNKVLVLAGVATDKVFEVFEKFNGEGQKGIEGLTQRIKNFDMKGVITAISTTGQALGVLWNIMQPFIPLMPYFIAGWVGWNVALKAFAAYKIASVIWNIGAAMTAGLGPMGAMTTAVGALGKALLTISAPFLAMAPVLGTAGGLLLVSAMTSKAMKDNGWGDNRSSDQLLKEAEDYRNKKSNWEAPNAKEAEARRIQSTYQGTLTVAAPKGSTLTQKTTGAPTFDVQLLGAN